MQAQPDEHSEMSFDIQDIDVVDSIQDDESDDEDDRVEVTSEMPEVVEEIDEVSSNEQPVEDPPVVEKVEPLVDKIDVEPVGSPHIEGKASVSS